MPARANRPAERENARQVQPDGQHQPANRQNKYRRGELKPPPQRHPRAAQCQQKPGKGREAHHRPGGIGCGFQSYRAARRATHPRQGHGLHGEHGEDAGHQVQDHPADQCKNQRLPQRQKSCALQQRGGDFIAQPPPALIGQQQHAFKRGEVLRPLSPPQRQFQPIRAMAHALRRRVIQKPTDPRDEQRFLQAFAPKARAGQPQPQRIALNARTGLPR